MQEDINKIREHFSSWQLNKNASKSKVLHLGHNNPNQNYSLDDVAIPEKNACRDLGIQVTDDNKFSTHMKEIARSAFFKLKQIRIAFSCKDTDFQMYLYTTYATIYTT